MWADQPIREWIDTVCRQYSRVMGCALTFDPHPETASFLPTAGFDDQWRATIGDGTQTVGVLKLRCRSGRLRDAGFLQACEAAELTAQLIEHVVTARGANEFGERDPLRRNVRFDQGEVHDAGPKSIESFSTSPVTTKVDRLLDVIRRFTGFPAAALFVHDPETGLSRLCAIRTTETLEPVTEAIVECQSAFFHQGSAEQVAVFRRSIDPADQWAFLPVEIATGVGQRLQGKNGGQGALWLFDGRDRRLSPRDCHALTRVTARLEQHIDQAQLIDESSQSRVLKGELRAASRTHPSSPIEYTPNGGWCEVAGCMQSVRGIGGDLFELIPLADERLFVAMGDAAGHSIPAALVMANVRGAIRALFHCTGGEGDLPAGRPPHEVLSRVNSVLHDIVQSHQFMTMFCGILDRESLRFEYASAGHPQPLLLRDGQLERLESHGLVLGVTDDAVYRPAVTSLREGDVLTLYTDGITEASCRGRTQFGANGIEDIVRCHPGQSAREIRDRVWSAMQAHLTGSDQRDDRTLAVMRIAGRVD